MKNIKLAELRQNLDNLLDEVVNTGIPLEIERGGKCLTIALVEKVDKLQKLVYRPDTIIGNPDDLITINWEDEIKSDLS